MDKAVCGEARAGYAKAGVYKLGWEKMIAKFEGVSAPKEMVVGGAAATVGGAEYRVGVFTTHFESLVKKVEKIT